MHKRTKKECLEKGKKVKFINSGVETKGVIEGFRYHPSKIFGKIKVFQVKVDDKIIEINESRLI